jgi:HSP20 family protein
MRRRRQATGFNAAFLNNNVRVTKVNRIHAMAKNSDKKNELERITPSRALSPFEEMERLFEETFPRGWMHRWGWPSWGELTRPMERISPRVNVIDRDDEVIVRAEIPGVKKEDLDISLTENAVSLKGTTRHEEKEEKGDYYRCEIANGSFARTLSLPGPVDTEKAKASFEDGVLELNVPKISKAKRRRIKIE